jgi:hypothetical protein
VLVSLGQLAAAGIHEQGQVRPARRLCAGGASDGLDGIQGMVEQNVLGRRGQPLLAANDVADAHARVIDDACQVV